MTRTRILGFILALVVCIGLFPDRAAAAAEESTNPELPTPTIEWLAEDKVVGGFLRTKGQLILYNVPTGLIAFEFEITNNQTGQLLEYIRDGAMVDENDPYQSLCMGWFLDGPIPSGDYSARLRLLKNDKERGTFPASDWAVIPSFVYTDPRVFRPTPTDIHWENGAFAYSIDPSAGEDPIVFIEYRYTNAAGQTRSKYCGGHQSQLPKELHRRFIDFVNRFGEGEYDFRVRTISKDLLSAQHSPWSEWSETCHLTADPSAELDQIQSKLPSQPSRADKEAALNSVRKLDRNQLEAAMAADHSSSGVTKSVGALEQKLGLSADVKKDVNSKLPIDPADVSVIGAGLNAADADIAPSLTLSDPPADTKVPVLYRSVLQADLSLEGTVLNADGSLPVPVRITFPVPDGIDHDRLLILHYEHGSQRTPHLLRPYCYEENGRWMASFTVSHLSPFVFAESSSENNRSIAFSASEISRDAQLCAALYKKNGQMIRTVSAVHTKQGAVAIIDDESYQLTDHASLFQLDPETGCPVGNSETITISHEE